MRPKGGPGRPAPAGSELHRARRTVRRGGLDGENRDSPAYLGEPLRGGPQGSRRAGCHCVSHRAPAGAGAGELGFRPLPPCLGLGVGGANANINIC